MFDNDNIVEDGKPIKIVYKNVNRLLSEDEDGYFGYNSNKNYAYYDISQSDGGDFAVYNKTYNCSFRYT